MKVGILTFHRGPNYGGFLQAWCLREAIRQLPVEAEIINYKNPRHYETERFRWRLNRRIVRQYRKWTLARAFEGVYDQLAKGFPALSPDAIAWDAYDVVVVGSDVIWDYESAHFGCDPVYFGCVPGRDKVRWVSYAASCGKARANGRLPAHMADGLRCFSHISVRDDNTRDLVRIVTGSDPEVVVDPTWLLPEPDMVAPRPILPVMAIYAYHQVAPPLAARLRAFARRRNLRVIAYGFAHRWADRNYCGLAPMEWLNALKQSQCIVSGTFHGTLYALKMGKPFVTLDSSWIHNKVTAPLCIAGATERLVTEQDPIEAILDRQLDEPKQSLFPATEPIRNRSHRFLRRAVMGVDELRWSSPPEEIAPHADGA